MYKVISNAIVGDLVKLKCDTASMEKFTKLVMI